MNKIFTAAVFALVVGTTAGFLGCGEQTSTSVPQAKPTPKGLPAATSEAAVAGQPIVKTVCASCHLPGLAGAPKIGDHANWEPRIEQGFDTLADHAINGYQGPGGTLMPSKGGEESLTEEDVKNAVHYLIEIHSSHP